MKTWRSFAVALLLALGPLLACGSGSSSPPDVPLTDAMSDADVPAGDLFEETAGELPGDASDTGETVDPIDPAALELVEQGKVRLSAGESLSAMDSFDRALAIEPDLQDAVWGLVLARFQANVAMFTAIINLVNLKKDPDAPVVPTLAALSWQAHQGAVGVTIDGLYAGAMAQKARLDGLKTAKDTPLFSLEGGLPLSLGSLPMMNLCCDWDRGDAYAISSFNNVMLALAAFLGSQDADVSLERLKDIFRDEPTISNAITALLIESPKFLTLLPEGGADSWKATKDFLQAAAEDALESARLMGEAEVPGKPVATLPGGSPYLVLHGTFPSGATELEILWDGKSASLADTVERTRKHLAGDAEARLSLEGDVVVALGVLLDVVNRTIGFQTLLDSMGFDLPDIVGGLFATLDPDDPEQLVGLLGSLLPMAGIQPGTVEIDLATFFGTPFNLRDLLPNYGPEPGTEHSAFLKSFECPRVGFVLSEDDPQAAGRAVVHDPSATDAGIALLVASFASDDGTGDIFDTEKFDLVPTVGFDGFYTGPFQAVVGDAAGAPGDGKLVVPAGGSLAAKYVSAAHPESTAESIVEFPKDIELFEYGQACADDTTPWDAERFGETEFATSVEVGAPGQTKLLATIPADGKAIRTGLMAFKSPSFGGLLWIDRGEGFAAADQAGFAAVFNGILSALEAF